MTDYDTAYAAATDRSPFSNGFEGESWMAQWCNRCAKDTTADVDGGCPLVLVAFMDKTPSEWVPGPTDAEGRVSLRQRYRCVEFDPLP